MGFKYITVLFTDVYSFIDMYTSFHIALARKNLELCKIRIRPKVMEVMEVYYCFVNNIFACRKYSRF